MVKKQDYSMEGSLFWGCVHVLMIPAGIGLIALVAKIVYTIVSGD